jgi:hypothetical protein
MYDRVTNEGTQRPKKPESQVRFQIAGHKACPALLLSTVPNLGHLSR